MANQFIFLNHPTVEECWRKQNKIAFAFILLNFIENLVLCTPLFYLKYRIDLRNNRMSHFFPLLPEEEISTQRVDQLGRLLDGTMISISLPIWNLTLYKVLDLPNIIPLSILNSKCWLITTIIIVPQNTSQQLIAAIVINALLPGIQAFMAYAYFRWGHPWKRDGKPLNLWQPLTYFYNALHCNLINVPC